VRGEKVGRLRSYLERAGQKKIAGRNGPGENFLRRLAGKGAPGCNRPYVIAGGKEGGLLSNLQPLEQWPLFDFLHKKVAY